jgi:hypothetical protein
MDSPDWSAILLAAEIDALARRLLEIDPDAIHRLERILSDLRRECAAPKELH